MPIAESPRTRRLPRRGCAIAAAALAAVALTGCSGGATSQEQRSDTYSGDITTVVLRFDDSGAKQIGYTTAALDARVVGTDRDDIRVHRRLEYSDGDKPDEIIDRAGDTMTITARCPDRFVVGRPTCVARYEIEVPYGSVVRASSRFGDLTVTDTRAEVELRSHYGDVAMVAAAGEDTRYAVDAVSTTGHTAVGIPTDPAGIPVRLRTEDGSATATTEHR